MVIVKETRRDSPARRRWHSHFMIWGRFLTKDGLVTVFFQRVERRRIRLYGRKKAWIYRLSDDGETTQDIIFRQHGV